MAVQLENGVALGKYIAVQSSVVRYNGLQPGAFWSGTIQ